MDLLIGLFVVFIVLSLIGSFVTGLTDGNPVSIAILVLLIMAVVAAMIVGIVKAAKDSRAEQAAALEEAKRREEEAKRRKEEAKRRKEERARQEQERNLAALAAPPPVEVPFSDVMKSGDERPLTAVIAKRFNEYLREEHRIRQIKAKAKWREDRMLAHSCFGNEAEHQEEQKEWQKLTAEIDREKQALNARLWLPSDYFPRASLPEGMRLVTWDRLGRFPMCNEQGFLNHPRSLKSKDGALLCFFAPFLLVKEGKILYTERYQRLSAEATYTTEYIGSKYPASDEEVARRSWYHETKSGGPDLRYSDNPTLYSVYRGKVTLTLPYGAGKTFTHTFEFRNKTLAKQCAEEINALSRAVGPKNIVSLLFASESLVGYGEVIAKAEAEAEAHLAEERRKRQEEQERLEEERRITQLKEERKKLLRSLHCPTPHRVSGFRHTAKSSVWEAAALNEAYQDFLQGLAREKTVQESNAFVAQSHPALARIAQIDAALGRETEEDVCRLLAMKEEPLPPPAVPKLPPRFLWLNGHFGALGFWQALKGRLGFCALAEKRTKGGNRFPDFFGEEDFVAVKQTGSVLLLFPLCLVLFETGKPMTVFSYGEAEFSLSSREQDLEGEQTPAFGEWVGERHLHVNQDGTPSRRYRNNPRITTYRFTEAQIALGEQNCTFPVPSYEEAQRLKRAFDGYRAILTEGREKDLYALALTSAPLSELQEAVNTQKERELAEEKRKEEERLAEERRKEEERLAALAAAEEKKKAAIARQRALNEERKRQELLKQEEEKRVAALFGDSFEEELSKEEKKEERPIPFGVVGDSKISNTVFKVRLTPCAEAPAEAAAYFVTAEGQEISNKKKVSLAAAEEGVITLGFLLHSGVDFTAMKNCFLRFEAGGDLLGEMEFSMNISFYSDF